MDANPLHASTFRRLLSRLDPVAVQAALTGWVLGRREAAAPAQPAGGPTVERRCVLAADGNTLRGARRPDGAQVKVFGVYDYAQHLLLTQTAVGAAMRSPPFTTALATLPDLHEVVVTADALYGQREHAAWLRERGGHYLFTVKGNQPTLRRALGALPWGQVAVQRRRQSAHGRTESRSVKVIDLDGTSAAALFPHASRAIKVVRRRRDNRTGRSSTEVVYAITSLTYRQADPQLLACWIQGHWGIENRVYYVRDVTQGEDASGIRTSAGPEVMAILRNTALNLHRLDGHTNIATAQRRAGWRAGSAHTSLTAV